MCSSSAAKEARTSRTSHGYEGAIWGIARTIERWTRREPERTAHGPGTGLGLTGRKGCLGSGPQHHSHDTTFSSQTMISLLVRSRQVGLDVRYAMRILTAGVNVAPWRHPAHTARRRGRRESMPGAATATLLRHGDGNNPDETIIAPACGARARARYRRDTPAGETRTVYISALP